MSLASLFSPSMCILCVAHSICILFVFFSDAIGSVRMHLTEQERRFSCYILQQQVQQNVSNRSDDLRWNVKDDQKQQDWLSILVDLPVPFISFQTENLGNNSKSKKVRDFLSHCQNSFLHRYSVIIPYFSHIEQPENMHIFTFYKIYIYYEIMRLGLQDAVVSIPKISHSDIFGIITKGR